MKALTQGTGSQKMLKTKSTKILYDDENTKNIVLKT